MIKCKVCGGWFKTIKGYNIHYTKMHKYVQYQKEPVFDMNEMKNFITSEIRRILKDVNFNRESNCNSIKDVGILPNKITKIPVFNPFESDKRLVVKELKEELKKGINTVLQKVGSFDDQINFLETSVSILV